MKRAAPSGCESVDSPVASVGTPNGAYFAGKIAGRRDAAGVERDEARQHVRGGARRLRFERDHGADVRRDCAGRAARIARDLRPGLSELMHGRPGQAAADDGQLVEMRGGLRHESLRPADVAVHVGARSGGVQAPSFRSHMSVWLGAPARKMKMQLLAVLRSVGAACVVCAEQQPRVEHVGKVRGHEAGAGDAHEVAAGEALIRTGTPEC